MDMDLKKAKVEMFRAMGDHMPQAPTIPGYAELPDQARQLLAMAHLGFDPCLMLELMGAMVATGGLTKPPGEALRFYAGPVIVHDQGGWAKDCPISSTRVHAERLAFALGGSRWAVGPIEIAKVMYAATFEAPLQQDAADLYLWGSSAMCSELFDHTAEFIQINHLQMTGAALITDEMVADRHTRVGRAYAQLTAEIRRKVLAKAPKLPKELR